MMNMNLNGWEKLFCPYFKKTCRRVLGPYFESNDFHEVENESYAVTYQRGDVLVGISYLLESAPNYEFLIGLGCTKGSKNSQVLESVPLWYFLPKDAQEIELPLFWRFNSESQLEINLSKIQVRFMEKYLKSVMLNKEELLVFIHAFKREMENKRNESKKKNDFFNT